MSKNPEAEALKAEGNTEFAAKNFDAAVEKYTAAIAVDSSNHVYYSNRAAVYLEQSEWEKAAADATKCIEIDPTFVKGYFRLARAQDGANEYDAAIATVRAGLEKHPGNNELGRLLRAIAAKKKAAAAAARSGGGAGGPLAGVNQEEMMELHDKVQKTAMELATVRRRVMACQNEAKRMQLTQGEVNKFPDEAPLFQSVGKMFLSSTKSELDIFFKEQMELNKREAEALAKQSQYLERRKLSHEANIKDMLSDAA